MLFKCNSSFDNYPLQSDTGTVGESEMSTETTEEHRQLRDKLCNLKEKKFQIDNLLQELYTMREQQPGARPKQQTARINNGERRSLV